MKSTSVFFLSCLFLFVTGKAASAMSPGENFSSNPAFLVVEAGDDQTICKGDTAQLSVTGATTYQWSPASGLSCINCPNPKAFPDSTTLYFVSGNDGTIDSVLVSVSTPPQIISVVHQNPSDCNVSNGSIAIFTAVSPHAKEFSIDGGITWQNNAVFTALGPGTYNIVARNANGTCVVNDGSVTLTAPGAPVITNIAKTNPASCDALNGSIVILANGGIAPLEYSVNGGESWQVQNTFSQLGSGNYNIVVRNAGGSCQVNGDPVALTASPDEPAITDIFTSAPSNCNITNGLITVIVANDNGGFEYSINGGNSWQPGNSFTGIGEGTYHILARKNNGTCRVDGGFRRLMSANRPVVLGFSAVDPQGCSEPNGNITILAFGPSTLEFTINDGTTWQPSNAFPGLTAGNYDAFVRNNDGTCLTEVGSIFLEGTPGPVISGVSVTNPSACGQSDGSINIAASGSNALQYSINSGTTWSSSSSFQGLQNGTYNIAVRYGDGTCEIAYQLNPVQLAGPGNPPVINNISRSNPSACGINNGSIVINASGTGTLRYSINGGANFQNDNTFNGLSGGVYQVVVSIAGSNCSATANAVLNAPSCVDTVLVNIPPGTTTEYCLEPAVLDIPGNPTGAGFCNQGNAATVAATAMNLTCVKLTPAGGFTGLSPDLICTVLCYNNSTVLCDTTYIRVNVQAPVDCDNIFLQDTLVAPYLGNPTPVCIPLSPSYISAFDLLFNGAPLGFLQGCDYDSVVVYTYAFLAGGGFNGPYTLDGWKVNSNTFTGFFNNVNELVELMNTFDPQGNWQINAQASIIFGGNLDNQYGDIQLTHVPTGSESIQMTNFSIVPNGFLVNLTSPNLNTLVASDPGNQCSDTLFINPFNNPVTPDTIYLTTSVNQQTAVICLDASELPGDNIQDVGFCKLPAHGQVPLVNDTCGYYLPNLNYAGQDTFCVVVCGGGFPNQVCDTTLVIITVLPAKDTIYLNIPAGVASVDTCLDNAVIELPGSITSGALCGINQDNMQGAVNVACLNFAPLNSFTGTTQACVVHCSGTVCDTTIVFITVEAQVVCEDVFAQNAVSILSTDGAGTLCIPVTPGSITAYEVRIDGAAYDPLSYIPCDFKEKASYSYAGLSTGPFILDSWTLNGTTFSGNMSGLSALVDSMNVWNAGGKWTNDLSTNTLSGGIEGTSYGNLVISQGGVGNVLLTPQFIQLPTGSQVTITGIGTHEVIVDGPDGCSDTVKVILEKHIVKPDTVYLETMLNTSISPICISTEELLGSPAGLSFCSLASHGSLGVVNNTCVSYIPGLNYTGNDFFCMVICDNHQPQVCDTLAVFITVQIPKDTVFIKATTVEPFDTCLGVNVLQLPGAIATADVCEINPDEVNLILNGNCATIDLANAFEGTTTMCIVHCTADQPAVCDTTILIVQYEGVVTNCPTIFDPDEKLISLSDGKGEICLPIPVTDIIKYEVSLDGNLYGGSLTACDFDSAYIYSYGMVFGQGGQGPYSVAWTVNGNTFTATVANMTELIGYMNSWDPAGDWTLESSTFSIISHNTTGVYGNLTIAHVATGVISNLAPDFNGIPAGTMITISGAGTHIVVIKEKQTSCEDTLTVNALNMVNVLDIETVENVPSQVVCLETSGLPGNFTSLSVCQEPAHGIIIINNNCFTFNPASGYVGEDQACLLVCDNLGNCDTTLLNITVTPLCGLFNFFPEGTQQIQVNNCAELVGYCTPVKLDSLVNFTVFDNGELYGGNFTACNGNLAQITLDTGLHEIVFRHTNTGCRDTLLANVSCAKDTTVCGIVALSDLPLVAEDCDSLALFCINLAFEALSNYSISDNGAPFTSNPKTCGGENQFAAIPLDTGFHRLVLTDTVKGCADTFEVQVRCLVLEDVFIETSIPVADSSTFCLIDYNIIPAGIDSVQNLCPGSGNATFNVDEETWCITVLGQEIGLDSACFKVFLGDTSVTVYFKVTVTQPCPDYFPEDFLAGGMPCTLDTGLICLPITLIEMQNKQFSINGQLYTGPVEPCDYDSIFVLNYTELPSDGLFGPYTITNWTVNDTLTFAGAFNSVQEMVDSMNLWDTEGGWTVLFDPISQATLIVGGSPQKKYGPMDVVQDLTGSEVTLGINLTYIPFGVMIEVPVGTYELTLTDTVTLCTETVTVEMTCVTSEIVRDTIQAGITDTLCLDISELLGTVNSIENICPSTGDTVLFSIDSTCVIYQGIAVGPDTACMVVCDDVGVCDTTYFYIQVILPDEQPPVAVNDTVVTGQDNVTTIFVLENDTIVLTEEFAIIDPPLHGDAVFLPDGTVSYVPQTAYCNDAEPDRFTYEICNPFGCDTAIVFITVQCGELEIFNAFSPNSDEINDFFRINGLQNYPDHKLIVFNRWGNRVFEANNYQNDWNGIWNGKELPDGTYFYYLDLGDGESPRSGYLQLNR